MTAYTTELSMPLVGITAEAVLAEVRGVLAAAPEDRGWTSSFGPPERARPDGPAL